ncbi:hypothetical protein [Hartmannibacter diazotrophicus]|nr:hypothetical protein [Hartmannibacter diazotrophicus]
MFLLRVEITSAKPFQIIVPLQGFELPLHDRGGFHGGKDRGDPAVDFE